MNIVRMVAYGIVLLAGLLWLSSKVEAVPSGPLCQGTADSLWDQWGKGMLPKTEGTVDKVLQFRQDCPQQGGSMLSIANSIRAHQTKQAEATMHADKYNKALDNRRFQSPAYDPAGLPGRTGPTNN